MVMKKIIYIIVSILLILAAATGVVAYCNSRGPIVYTTLYGECYHSSDSCYSLRKSQFIYETRLKNAESKGFHPCKICYKLKRKRR